MPKYYVTTWDSDLQMFTPQDGVQTGPYSKWGLRKAIRELRNMGYDARRNDSSTMIESRRTEAEISNAEVCAEVTPENEAIMNDVSLSETGRTES